MNLSKKKSAGRPRSESVKAAIIQATSELMAVNSISSITIEAVAKKAKVGKPTIYRWWDSKCDLVLETFLEKSSPHLPIPRTKNCNEFVTKYLDSLASFLNGNCGSIIAQIIGEGQSDHTLLADFRDKFAEILYLPIRERLTLAESREEVKLLFSIDSTMDFIFAPMFHQIVFRKARISRALIIEIQQMVNLIILAKTK